MKNDKRKIRQEKLAKLFYEMGMDVETISKISGVEVERIVRRPIKENLKENY